MIPRGPFSLGVPLCCALCSLRVPVLGEDFPVNLTTLFQADRPEGLGLALQPLAALLFFSVARLLQFGRGRYPPPLGSVP